MRASRLPSIMLLRQARGRSDRGSGGGFQLMEGYKTQLTGLTAEAGALVLFGLPNAAADLGLGEAMTAARRKIDAALPDTRRRGARD